MNEPREDGSWEGCFVSNLLPRKFERYVKILHRLEPNFENIDHPLDPDEIKILSIPNCDQLVSLLSHHRSSGSRLLWRDVASALRVPYLPEISDEWFRKRLEPGCWPRYIYGPAEGCLEDAEYEELVTILARTGSDPECFYRIAEIPYIATDAPILFEGFIGEALSIPTAGMWKAPEYWWAGTHQWCICSDYDMSFTIAAGPSQFVNEVLRSPVLEALEVLPDTRIDYFAPIPLD